jgi:tRNA-2-methylthio-N6-dimethylallyladenosine synthase
MAYMFKYSERPRTLAERKFENDISEDVKSRRLQEIMTLQRVHGTERTLAQKGKTYKVLIEGTSKKRDDQFFGRNTYNTVVVFPKGDAKAGTYVNVKTHSCTVATLIGEMTEDKADA